MAAPRHSARGASGRFRGRMRPRGPKLGYPIGPSASGDLVTMFWRLCHGGAERMSDYEYDHQTVQGFILSAIFWGVVGILIGLLIAIQMPFPAANFAPWLTFGRLRPVHTNGLAFGLGVGAIFGLSYYIVMRLSKRPLLFPRLARLQLWIFNAAIAAAALSLMMGHTQSLEYAELEWPLDIGVVILWVMFAV